MGFCLPDNWKVCITFEMVPLTVPSANVLKRESENLPLLTDMANAPLKFDLRIHHSAVVLSVINKAQSPHSRRPESKSIQGVIVAARYSSELLVAQNWR